MTQARMIRRARFTASHHYGWPQWSEEENRRVFGAQVEAHRHDWMVEVHVAGPVGEGSFEDQTLLIITGSSFSASGIVANAE